MKENVFNGAMDVFGALFDLVLLQLLFVLTSLPVFTMGASLTALFSIIRRLRQDSVTSVFRSYFQDFCRNFKTGTVVWLIVLAVSGVLYLNLSYYGKQPDLISNSLQYLFSLLAILWMLDLIYLFPLMAWVESGKLAYFKNAFLMAFKHLPTTIGVILVYLAAEWVAIRVFPFFVLFGISGAVYIASNLQEKALARELETGKA